MSETPAAPEGCFTFEAPDGSQRTLSPTIGTLTPGLVRRHREMDQASFNVMLFELLADDAALDAFDTMSWAQNKAMMLAFEEHIQEALTLAVGESVGSSNSSTSTRKRSSGS